MTVSVWWVPVSFVLGAWIGAILMGLLAGARRRR